MYSFVVVPVKYLWAIDFNFSLGWKIILANFTCEHVHKYLIGKMLRSSSLFHRYTSTEQN